MAANSFGLLGRTFCLLLAFAIVGSCAAQFTAKDMHSLKRLGGFAAASSSNIVYTVSHWVRVIHQAVPS